MLNKAEQLLGISRSVEHSQFLIKNRRSVFETTKHYWKEIGREFVTEPGFEVANLGSGTAIEAIPFAYALEGKSRRDLVDTIRHKPVNMNVNVENYEIDPDEISLAKNGPLIRIHSAPPEKYHQEDIRNLSIPDESIDICLLRHPNYNGDFRDNTDRTKVFSEIKRVLKKGGISWTNHYLPEELEITSTILSDHFPNDFKILIKEEYKSPVLKLNASSPTIGNAKKLIPDGFVLIAEKI